MGDGHVTINVADRPVPSKHIMYYNVWGINPKKYVPEIAGPATAPPEQRNARIRARMPKRGVVCHVVLVHAHGGYSFSKNHSCVCIIS